MIILFVYKYYSWQSSYEYIIVVSVAKFSILAQETEKAQHFQYCNVTTFKTEKQVKTMKLKFFFFKLQFQRS